MFTENMTYSDMDKILKDICWEKNLNVVELANRGELAETDIELFLAAYLKEFRLEEKDLNNAQKVSSDIFDLASILQSLKVKEMFDYYN